MSYTVSTRTQLIETPGLDGTIYVLEDGKGGLAQVWPALGFNCFQWQVLRQGEKLDLLYADPQLFANGRPTRSGIPVLFPFPNRIRDGAFTFEGQTYKLPLNDSTQKNAIHGFACRTPWRVTDSGATEESAWVTGTWRCSVDAPGSLSLWPADHEISLAVRLGHGVLRLEARVSNPDTRPLPFGLGYHPYFKVPFGAGDGAACRVEVPAAHYWELAENLPTGKRVPVDAGRDLNRARPYGQLQLDDVLTDLPKRPARMDGLIERGVIHGASGEPMRLFCSPAFREMVVFTPPHRQAFCIEPYTCTTDAANMSDRDESGWLVLPAGQTWSAVVELWV